MTTRKELEQKTAELIKVLDEFEESKQEAAIFICSQVVAWVSINHYEGLGIIAETLFSWRENSLEAIAESQKEEKEVKKSE